MNLSYMRKPLPSKAKLLFALVLSSSFPTFSQSLTLSPYSRFALGDLQQPLFVRGSGMGQAVQAVRSRSNLNPANPASYSALGLTTFEAGLHSSFTTLKTNADIQTYRNSGFNYVALGFPISEKKKIGGSVGLMPFSSVGYKITEERDYGFAKAFNVFEGGGGLSKLYLGFGKDFWKRLSIGVQGSYIFGNMTNVRNMTFSDPTLHNLKDDRSKQVSGFFGEAGFQFHFDIKDSSKVDILTGKRKLKHLYNMCIGGTSNMQTNLNGTQQVEVFSYQFFGGTLITDTVLYQPAAKGNIVYPMGFSGGMVFQEFDQWSILADVGFRQWKNFTNFGNIENLANQLRFSLGYSYIPDFSAEKKRHYMRTVEYRAGLRYDQGFLSLNSTRVGEKAISIGLGLPFILQKQLSDKEAARIQLSLEFVNRGTTKQNLISENYFRFLFGITFNDKWFQQRKIY